MFPGIVDAPAQIGLRHVLKNELSFENASQVAVSAIEAALRAIIGQPLKRYWGGCVATLQRSIRRVGHRSAVSRVSMARSARLVSAP